MKQKFTAFLILSLSFGSVAEASICNALLSFFKRPTQVLLDQPVPADVNSPEFQLWQGVDRLATATATDYWSPVRAQIQCEVKKVRMLSKLEQEKYFLQVGDEVLQRLKEHFKTEELAFHYNLHGGYFEDYVSKGGIHTSRGDVVYLQTGGREGDGSEKIYFFRSSKINLFEVLNATDPQFPIPMGRMGSVLMAFRLDSEYFTKGLNQHGINNLTEISANFDPEWVLNQPISKLISRPVGIPASEFIAPPVKVFVDVAKKLSMGSLSRKETTLVMLRYLENYWMSF